MMNAAITMEVNAEPFQKADAPNWNIDAAIKKIDSCTPLAVAVGVAVSVPALFGMLAVGMNVERVLLETVLSGIPAQTLASVVIGMSVPTSVETFKAGLSGDAVKALAFGGSSSFLIGTLGAIAGF